MYSRKGELLLYKKIFTLFFWSLGLNDPYLAKDQTLGRFSYLRKIRNKNKWLLIDCGSYKGKFAESAAKHLCISQIIFIDINTKNNKLLKKKFPNAKIINAAIAEKKGELSVITNRKNPGESFASSTIKTKVRIKSITLNEIMETIKLLPSVDIFLKLDIEGNEVNILKTLSQQWLQKLTVISLEIIPNGNSLNFINRLNEYIPLSYEFYRERRSGLIYINRKNPHWTDSLNLFQNLILINSSPRGELIVKVA